MEQNQNNVNDLILEIIKDAEKGIYTDIFLNKCEFNKKSDKSKSKKMNRDHVWPKSKGGTGKIDNIIYMCRDSNVKKGNRTRKAKVKEIKFSIIETKDKKSNRIGYLNIYKSTISDDYYQFLNYYNLIKKEYILWNNYYILIDNQSERNRMMDSQTRFGKF